MAVYGNWFSWGCFYKNLCEITHVLYQKEVGKAFWPPQNKTPAMEEAGPAAEEHSGSCGQVAHVSSQCECSHHTKWKKRLLAKLVLRSPNTEQLPLGQVRDCRSRAFHVEDGVQCVKIFVCY